MALFLHMFKEITHTTNQIMKKLILFVALAFAVQVISAQITLKPTAGLNVSSATKDPESGEARGKIGYQFGASAIWGNKFYIEPGVYYQQINVEYTSSTDEELNFDKKTKGIRVPLQVGFNVLGNRTSDINIHIFGGGSGYFVTSVDGNVDKDEIESPQWGALAGAGVDLWFFFLDLKYEWSLTDITSVTQFDIGKTHAFYINAGVRFRFGGGNYQYLT